MPQTKEQRATQARNRRLWICFHLLPEERERIEHFQKNHEIFRLLLGKRISMDHSHETGLVRGLLEWRINKGYGLIEKAAGQDTAKVLRALADFYDNPPATQVLGGPRYGLIGLAKVNKRKMVYGPPEAPTGTMKGKK